MKATCLLLLTIVGIGVIVGLVEVREALVNELIDLADAINGKWGNFGDFKSCWLGADLGRCI